MSVATVKSGELFSFVTSGSRGWAKYYSESGPAFLRVGNLDHDSISLDLREIQRVQPPQGSEGTRTRVRTNDILISVTADVGMIGLVPESFEEGYINQHVALARPIADVHAPYLAWCLASPASQKQFKELQRGATKVGLGLDDIRAIDVRVPSVPEQRRIVAEIEKQFTRLEAGVAALRRVQANLKRYRAAVLKAACEGQLVPTEAELHRKLKTKNSKLETGAQLLARILAERRKSWTGRGKYKEPAAPDTANLPPLPEGWTWASVAQVSSTIVDCPHSTAKFVSDGMPCVDTTCIKPGKIVREKLRFVSPQTYEERVQRLVPATNDIVFAREGTVGTAVAIPEGLKPCLGQRVMLMRSDACITPQYFQHCLNSQTVREQYLPKIIGSTAPHINVAEVKILALPLPPLAEQTRIVAEVERRLSVVEELESVVSANLQRATRLRQSILQKAFTGELT